MSDLNTYWGRFWHYFQQNDPRNVYKIEWNEEEIKKTIKDYESKTDQSISKEKYQLAKYAYDSAFHPDTGNKINMCGRMSFQVIFNQDSILIRNIANRKHVSHWLYDYLHKQPNCSSRATVYQSDF